MGGYWFRHRSVATLVVAAVVGLVSGLLFVFPYISQEANMGVPKEIREVERPTNTIVCDNGKDTPFRYAVRERAASGICPASGMEHRDAPASDDSLQKGTERDAAYSQTVCRRAARGRVSLLHRQSAGGCPTTGFSTLHAGHRGRAYV